MQIEVNAKVRNQVNFAACVFISPILESLQIIGCKQRKLILRVSGKPQFIFEYKQEITPENDRYTINGIKLQLDDGYYRQNVIEAKEAVLDIELLDPQEPGTVLAFVQKSIHLQPYLHWERKEGDAYLTCFMQPNDPLVARVLGRAGEIANDHGQSMTSYSWLDACPPRDQARWIYDALKEEVIHYYYPAASFEQVGQKIRVPGMILNEDCKQGTCLDLAVLYATCLEAARLNPVLFLVSGHAYAGVWLQEASTLGTAVCLDKKTVSDVMAVCCDEKTNSIVTREGGTLLPVECTLFTDKKAVSFDYAVFAGAQNHEKMGFIDTVDVRCCRAAGYQPTFTFTNTPICDGKADMIPAETNVSKLNRLRNQAMNLSLRNPLLSMDNDKSGISGDLPAEQFFAKTVNQERLNRLFKEGTDRGDGEARLKALFRAQSQAKREKGYGVVHLAVSQLRWIPIGSDELLTAPVYLCPVDIFRNIRGEVAFRADPENSRLNPALKEILRSDFAIDLSCMQDFPGERYVSQTALLTNVIATRENWALCENTGCLSIFEMPDEAIYQALKLDSLAAHDVVHGILEGKNTWPNAVPDEATVESTIYAFPADCSQRKLIRSVNCRRAQVLMGPAGNGKSQTITNIISEMMAAGKHVLFVAEKPAAQSVVYQKLEELGLDPFCLLLSAGKTAASELNGRVEQTLKYVRDYEQQYVDEDALSKYERAAEQIDRYDTFLNQKQFRDKSLLDLLDEAEQYSEIQECIDPALLDDSVNHPDAEDILMVLSDALSTFTAAELLDISRMTSLRGSAAQTERSEQLVREALSAWNRWNDATAQFELQADIPILGSDSVGEKAQVEKYAELLKKCPIVGRCIPNLDDGQIGQILLLAKELTSLMPHTQRYMVASEQLWSMLERQEEKSAEVQDDWDISAMRDRLRGARVHIGLTEEEIKQGRAVKAFQKFERQILEEIAERSEEEQHFFLQKIRTVARGEGQAILNAASDLLETADRCRSTIELAADKVLGVSGFPEDNIVLLTQWEKMLTQRGEIRKLNRILEHAEETGISRVLSGILSALADGRLTAEKMLPAFRKSRLNYNISHLLEQTPGTKNVRELPLFLDTVDSLETCARKAYRAKLKNSVVGTMPNMEESIADSADFGALRKLARCGGAASVREVFQQGGSALRQMFPCMIMSPSVAAQCITEDFPQFDLVIFDEGSQLPTYKALYPISKAHRCLIVGDEKQLTPTSFFQKYSENEQGIAAPVESILEDAVITSMPKLMLKYHYRSQYESLVAFSNSRYYDEEIITFPSPDTAFTGVRSVFVENGVYDRGGNRSNLEEARCVIALITDIYRALPPDTTDTLGVITFNLEQKKLVEYLLSQTADLRMPELVDVVNLEACQGQEWDVTILSTTYGSDASGEFSGNLGPMNRDEGANRLNVMITRARKQMYVVTSMKPEQLGEKASGGLRDLRDFLSYAAGDLSLDTRVTDCKNVDRSGSIGDAVIQKLRQNGYIVHSNIGSSNCKVDIGVVSENGKSYRLGILLDHGGCSDPVDRETIVPRILKNKGWNLYRLRSVDWHQNPDYEWKKLMASLN